jgi:curved DNA-binding protein CbpA
MTPGEQAKAAINEADKVLADPSKAEFHDRVREARNRMQKELDWWTELGIAMREYECTR